MKKQLTTQARDNHGYRYDVEIQDIDSKPVLRILGTPGGWFYTDVRNHGQIISLDFGQSWDCVNFDEVLREARVLVEAELDAFGVYRWIASKNIVPADILDDAGIAYDAEARRTAVARRIDELRGQMMEAERNMTDEERAERDFEMRAAFGEGVTVVNVFTGQTYRS